MRKFRWLAIVLAFVLVAAACGGDDDDADTTTTAGDTQDTVDLTQGGDLTFHMVTHSDDGPFWSVVKRGMDDACAAVGVNCVWAPSVNTPEKQVQDIEAAITAGSNGIAISLASPDQVGPAAEKVVAAGCRACGHALRCQRIEPDLHGARGPHEHRGHLPADGFGRDYQLGRHDRRHHQPGQRRADL